MADPSDLYGLKKDFLSTEKRSFRAGTSIVFVVPLFIVAIKRDLPVIFTVWWTRPDNFGEIHVYLAKIPKEISPENYMRNSGIFIEDKQGNIKAVAPLNATPKPKFVSAPGLHRVVGVQLELDGRKSDIKERCKVEYLVTK